jgi:UDP-galactopyranose mutase
MTRFARDRRVFFIEEPVFDAGQPHASVTVANGVHVVVPHLRPADAGAGDAQMALVRKLLAGVLEGYNVSAPIAWFYTPMALPLLQDVRPSAVVFDCMDELTGFAHAPAGLRELERALLMRADVVFTGGHALYEAKRDLHANVHAFPSSVDVAHFATGSRAGAVPADQRAIARPRIGFCGVIDERMDLGLVDEVARRKPEWQFVMIGPVVKIDPASLPRHANIHYLGLKSYAELPVYLGGWDVAILPFARNDATRFISPTKTPEYLAAGCPVVSTSIRDVVRPYGEGGLVSIADEPGEFAAAIAHAMTPAGRAGVLRAQPLLQTMSWDRTFSEMRAQIDLVLRVDGARPAARPALVAQTCSTI